MLTAIVGHAVTAPGWDSDRVCCSYFKPFTFPLFRCERRERVVRELSLGLFLRRAIHLAFRLNQYRH
jgi:hypothetical protein